MIASSDPKNTYGRGFADPWDGGATSTATSTADVDGATCCYYTAYGVKMCFAGDYKDDEKPEPPEIPKLREQFNQKLRVPKSRSRRPRQFRHSIFKC